MSRDWLLTLLVLSPFILTATIVSLALIERLARNQRVRHTAGVRGHDGGDQIEEAERIPT
jgi:hypothetical protein